MVPDSIMALSCQHDAGSEDALRLASLIFEVLGSVSQNPETVDASNCSPRVAETLFYFVERWSQTYLLIDVREYRKMSSTIAKAYTSDGQGKQLMQYIVEKIHQNFAMWTADPDVLLRVGIGSDIDRLTSRLSTCSLLSVKLQHFAAVC